MNTNHHCPLPLIEVKENKLYIVPSTVDILRQRFGTKNEPCQIIGLVGDSRLGKSTLCQLLVNQLHLTERKEEKDNKLNSRFEAKNGDRSVTSGIYIWSHPLTLPNGNQVLLLDTQGTNRGNDSINVQIVSLTCMISSLLILNIEGALNESHRTLLFMIHRCLSKVTGSTPERRMMFPKLLIRSREYRLDDFKRDFPLFPSTGTILLQDRKIRDALDLKLETQLLRENVDSELKQATRTILDIFPERHWMVTWNATEQDEKVLQIRPEEIFVAENNLTPFAKSMKNLIAYILQLSQPKLFGESQISMYVLASTVKEFIQRLQDETKQFHVPTLLDSLQQEEIDHICETGRTRYQTLWEENKQPIETSEECQRIHEQFKQVLEFWYESECKKRKLPTIIIRQGGERFRMILQNCFLVPQQQLSERLNQRMVELQEQANEDHVRQQELGQEMKQMQSQVQSVSSQIYQIQQEAAQTNAKLQSTSAEVEKARKEWENTKENSGGGGMKCIIL